MFPLNSLSALPRLADDFAFYWNIWDHQIRTPSVSSSLTSVFSSTCISLFYVFFEFHLHLSPGGSCFIIPFLGYILKPSLSTSAQRVNSLISMSFFHNHVWSLSGKIWWLMGKMMIIVKKQWKCWIMEEIDSSCREKGVRQSLNHASVTAALLLMTLSWS